MSRLRIAVIGVGALGRHHARILSELEGVHLVAVSDTDTNRASEIAVQFGTRSVDCYTELFCQIDAVSIAVPTTAHFAVASEFLTRRIPVLVEKPLAGDLLQAQALVELSETYKTLLQVGHVERFNPASVVARNHCGLPKYIRTERLSPYAFRSTDIGVVHDLMIHDLDLVLDLTGCPVSHVDAFGISVMGDCEDIVQARLRFETGCIADLTVSRVNPVAKRTMQVWSDQGCVTVDLHRREIVCYSPSDILRYGTPPVELARQPDADIPQLKDQVFGRFINVTRPPVPDDDALTAELASFVDAVVTGRQPVVGGREALRAMEVADEILHSLETHCWTPGIPEATGPSPQFPEARKLAG